MAFDLNKLVVALACVCSLGAPLASQAAGLKDFVSQAPITSNDSGISTSAVADDGKDVPDWLRKSKRLEAMLGDGDRGKVTNAKVVSKVETPVPGIEGLVVQADIVNEANPEGKKELFVFYTDKTKRYLFVGMMIDTEKDRDMNLMTERYVRGQLADNPGKALRPQDMSGIVLAGDSRNKADPVQFVVDLAHENGKSSLLNVVNLQKALLASNKQPRAIRVIPVSAGTDESATGAMAIALGAQKIYGDGMQRLIEFARDGKKTAWMAPEKLRADAKFKEMMGHGIFQLEGNSTQAMLAKLDILPLVYDGTGERTKFIMLPTSRTEWEALLLKH